ncbi:MAG TPA: rhodanese-like domain-containing protein [Xanthobacteraceae bacterium]|nr:rhodanese-like domain-containing protein [Xanthobacteraceae bacterium]
MRFAIAIAALAACVISQPGLAASDWPDSVDRYVAQIRATIDTTDIAGYLAVVKEPNGALLLDVREDSEFKAGHVPGTVNVSRGRLEFQVWKPLGYPGPVDMNRKIYVQCASGNRATLAAKQLKDLGFTDVTAVVMDLAVWQNRGYPFIRDGDK